MNVVCVQFYSTILHQNVLMQRKGRHLIYKKYPEVKWHWGIPVFVFINLLNLRRFEDF